MDRWPSRSAPHARAGRANAGGVLSPEHHRIFRDAHWERGRIETTLEAAAAERGVSRFRRGGIMAVRAGGPAGLMSGILCGWGGDSDPVARVVED